MIPKGKYDATNLRKNKKTHITKQKHNKHTHAYVMQPIEQIQTMHRTY